MVLPDHDLTQMQLAYLSAYLQLCTGHLEDVVQDFARSFGKVLSLDFIAAVKAQNPFEAPSELMNCDTCRRSFHEGLGPIQSHYSDQLFMFTLYVDENDGIQNKDIVGQYTKFAELKFVIALAVRQLIHEQLDYHRMRCCLNVVN